MTRFWRHYRDGRWESLTEAEFIEYEGGKEVESGCLVLKEDDVDIDDKRYKELSSVKYSPKIKPGYYLVNTETGEMFPG